MKAPLLHDEAWLADVATARRTANALHLWWLGQSGFLLQWRGEHLLLDPYLSDSLTRKYAGTDKPHVRLTARVISPERLDFLAAVTSSHNHTDHLDPETLVPLAQVNPGLRLVCARANQAEASRRSGLSAERVIGLDPDQAPRSVVLGGFELEAVPAAHEHLERDAAGCFTHVGFLVQAGPFVIYHAGDTVWYESLPDRLRHKPVDVALLPINGRAPARRVAGNLDGREAAALAHAIGARVVVPCHYDLFAFNTATPDEFVEACQRLGQPFTVLAHGQRLTLEASPSPS